MSQYVKYFDAVHNPKKPYWDYDDLKKLESYNADICIAESPRNFGKSYAGRFACMKEMDKGETVGWLRYNKPEMAKALQTWKAYNPELVEVKNSGGTYLEDPCTAGRVLLAQWSISQSNKDTDLPFTRLVYDEFIPERYTNKTRLDTEFDDWYSTDTSLSRSYNPKKLMIANNIFWFNPFFLSWGIFPFSKGKIAKYTLKDKLTIDGYDISYNRVIAIENVGATPAIIQRNIQQQSLRFNNNADLMAYYDNQTKQEYTTIAKCPDMKKQLENYQIMTEGYYMNFRFYNGIMYWTKVNPNYDLDTYVSEPSYIDITRKHWRRIDISRELEDCFNVGMCAFDSGETLLAFMRWIRHLRGRI